MTSITTSPTVSVIIPAYNQAQYLPDALDSLLAQTYTNWEAVIVDDGSPDNVAEIAARYTGAIRASNSSTQRTTDFRAPAIREPPIPTGNTSYFSTATTKSPRNILRIV